ncbi:MAG: nucleotidyl transferase AbiEii/AbiGii toxin family protein [Bacillota bacterium]
MFWEILDKPRQVLLKKLVNNMKVPESYLAGGTALALMIGHRESYDFDWFTPKEFDPEYVYRDLSNIDNSMVTDMKRGTLHALVNGIRVTWLWYPNPLLKPLLDDEQVAGLKMASLLDIGMMKWSAISGRGAMRDFIDLYMICQKGYSMIDMLGLLPAKYPNTNINYYHMVKSLSYFEDAENDLMPKMLIPLKWEDVKDFFLRTQRDLLGKVTGR